MSRVRLIPWHGSRSTGPKTKTNRKKVSLMQINTTLAAAKKIMAENAKLALAVGQIMKLVASFVLLALMATAQTKRLMEENKTLKDENVSLAKQLAEIQAVFASQVVIDTESELVVTAKKPRKTSTARKPKQPKSVPVNTPISIDEMATFVAIVGDTDADIREDEEIR
jgi:Tfp pilus assembly protein PilN